MQQTTAEHRKVQTFDMTREQIDQASGDLDKASGVLELLIVWAESTNIQHAGITKSALLTMLYLALDATDGAKKVIDGGGAESSVRSAA